MLLITGVSASEQCASISFLAVPLCKLVFKKKALSVTFNFAFGSHREEALLESDVQRARDALLLPLFLQLVDRAPVANTIAIVRSRFVVLVGVVDTSQSLKVFHNLDGVLVDECILRNVVNLIEA